jgi:hypothetical protein
MFDWDIVFTDFDLGPEFNAPKTSDSLIITSKTPKPKDDSGLNPALINDFKISNLPPLPRRESMSSALNEKSDQNNSIHITNSDKPNSILNQGNLEISLNDAVSNNYTYRANTVFETVSSTADDVFHDIDPYYLLALEHYAEDIDPYYVLALEHYAETTEPLVDVSSKQEISYVADKSKWRDTVSETIPSSLDDLLKDLDTQFVVTLEDYVENRYSGMKLAPFFELDFIKALSNNKIISSEQGENNIGDNLKWGDRVFNEVNKAIEIKEDKLILDNVNNRGSVSADSLTYSPTIQSRSSVEFRHSEFIGGKKVMQNGTLYGLLKHLFDPINVDFVLLHAFLLHLNLLISSSDLLDLILRQWQKNSNTSKSSDVLAFQMVNILNFWIDNFPSDILDDQKLSKKLSDFIYLNRFTTPNTGQIFMTLSLRLENKVL